MKERERRVQAYQLGGKEERERERASAQTRPWNMPTTLLTSPTYNPQYEPHSPLSSFLPTVCLIDIAFLCLTHLPPQPAVPLSPRPQHPTVHRSRSPVAVWFEKPELHQPDLHALTAPRHRYSRAHTTDPLPCHPRLPSATNDRCERV